MWKAGKPITTARYRQARPVAHLQCNGFKPEALSQQSAGITIQIYLSPAQCDQSLRKVGVSLVPSDLGDPGALAALLVQIKKVWHTGRPVRGLPGMSSPRSIPDRDAQKRHPPKIEPQRLRQTLFRYLSYSASYFDQKLDNPLVTADFQCCEK